MESIEWSSSNNSRNNFYHIIIHGINHVLKQLLYLMIVLKQFLSTIFYHVQQTHGYYVKIYGFNMRSMKCSTERFFFFSQYCDVHAYNEWTKFAYKQNMKVKILRFASTFLATYYSLICNLVILFFVWNLATRKPKKNSLTFAILKKFHHHMVKIQAKRILSQSPPMTQYQCFSFSLKFCDVAPVADSHKMI